MRFLVSSHLQGATRPAASCLASPTWLAASETAFGSELWYPHDPLGDIRCKPNSPVSQSDTLVWVVMELPAGDITWWMRLNSSVCLFHLITSPNYSVLLNVPSAAPLFLSRSLFKNICKPHSSVSQWAFFSFLKSTQFNLLAELFALLTVTFSWRLWCNMSGSCWKVVWRRQCRILFLSLFACWPHTHIKT